MPEVRRTIAHVSQGGARPSHAGAEKRDKLCVTLGEQTAPAATPRRAALRSLYLATPRFQAVTSRCEGEQQVSQNLEPSSAAECGRDLRRAQCTATQKEGFSDFPRDKKTSPSLRRSHSRKLGPEQRRREPSGPVLIFRMSIQAQSDRRLGFYTHRGGIV